MQKQTPSVARLALMAVFALSCFGILTFLWLSFGGSLPLKPEKYRVMVNFPEATTLAEQADVRIAGVNVGKVQSKKLNKGATRTTVELAIERKYAPIPRDTRTILRQKTLLGETFVELTPGDEDAGILEDGDTLANAQVEPTVELDEILRIFDPDTKAAFRNWVRSSATQIEGQAQNLNNAFGNLATFAEDGAGVLRVLDTQQVAVRQLIRNTGVVFNALNEREGQLRGLISNGERTFSALAAERDALEETFRVFPVFLDESRSTLDRLERFSRNTDPLITDLKPAADDLGPTVVDLAALAPHLERLFRKLPPVIRHSDRALPEGARFVRGLGPVLEALHVFLPEFNPILAYLNYDQARVAHFFVNGAAATRMNIAPQDGIPGFGQPQLALITGDSLGFKSERPAWERGNSYGLPNLYDRAPYFGAIESFDCKPSGGEQPDPREEFPPCFVQGPHLYNKQFFPRLGKGDVRRKKSPALTLRGTRPANPNR